MTSIAKLRMAALMTGWFFLRVYQSPQTTAAVSSVKKKMVPLLKGSLKVLTKRTSTAESTLTMPGIMPQRMTPRVTSEMRPVAMKPFQVVLGHFLK